MRIRLKLSVVVGASACILGAWTWQASGWAASDDPLDAEAAFQSRRQRLLELLTSPEMLRGDVDSGGYSYRRRWQYYHACLAKGVRLDEANDYFATSDEIVADEWPVLVQLRTYFAFKDTVLSEAARKHLAEAMIDYCVN
ncbi:MAG: hypothetical protein ACYTG0_21340 [Planctomycetota bacterium]|jgi:hypothetical protein